MFFKLLIIRIVILLLVYIVSQPIGYSQEIYYSRSGIHDFVEFYKQEYSHEKLSDAEDWIKTLSTDSLHNILKLASRKVYLVALIGESSKVTGVSNEVYFSEALYGLLAFNRLTYLRNLNAYAYFNAANIKHEMGANKEAIQDYTKALNNNDSHLSDETIIGYRGCVKVEIQDYYGAIVDLTIAIDAEPGKVDEFWYQDRAKSYTITRQFSEALDDFNTIIAHNPQWAEAYFGKGYVLLELNDKKQGCENLSKAGELGHPGAYDAIQLFCQ